MKYFVCLFICAVSLSFSRDAYSASFVPSAETYYHVILGLHYERNGDFEHASAEYKKAISKDANDPFLLTRMAIASARVGRIKESVAFAEKANKMRPHDPAILDLLADLYSASDIPDKAILIHNEIIALSPNAIEGYVGLAEFLARQKDFPGAILSLEKGLVANPSSHLAHYYLGKLFASQKEYEKGIKHYQEAIALAPDFFHAYLSSASVYELLGKISEAEQVYRQILSKDRMDHEEASLRLSSILAERKSFSEAMSILTRLSNEDPRNPDILLAISLLWAQQKEYKKGLEWLNKVAIGKPLSKDLQVYSASLYEGAGEYEEAIKTYRGIIQDGGDAYTLHLRIGEVYLYRLKKFQEALVESEYAQKLDAKKHAAYLLSGLALHELERLEEAVVVFLKGIVAAPNQADLHFHLGVTYDKLKRFDALVAEMKKAISIDGKHAMALNYLGYTYVERGIFLEEAVDLINRALALRPSDGYVIDSLGWAYYKQGNIKAALITLENAVGLVPDDPVILEHLGEVYLKENRNDESKKAWSNSLKLDPKNEKLKIRFKDAGFDLPEENTLQNIIDVHPSLMIPY
jgi:tetratricopeptide (TPR) repeat protein